MSPAALAQRRQVDREHGEPVVEVLAERAVRRTIARRSRLVAADQADVDLDRWRPADALERLRPAARAAASPAARAAARRSRRGRTCRRRPPRSGPACALVAPVNAPFSWPNSSLSSRCSGRAAQLTPRTGLAARGLQLVDRARRRPPCRCRSRRGAARSRAVPPRRATSTPRASGSCRPRSPRSGPPPRRRGARSGRESAWRSSAFPARSRGAGVDGLGHEVVGALLHRLHRARDRPVAGDDDHDDVELVHTDDLQHAAMPSMPGRTRSSSTMAGGSSRQRRRASGTAVGHRHVEAQRPQPVAQGLAEVPDRRRPGARGARGGRGGPWLVLSHGRNACAVRRRSSPGSKGLSMNSSAPAGAARLAGRGTVRGAGQHDHAGLRRGLPGELRQGLEAAEPRHLEVEDDASRTGGRGHARAPRSRRAG